MSLDANTYGQLELLTEVLAVLQRPALFVFPLSDLAVLSSQLDKASMELADDLLDLGVDTPLAISGHDPDGVNLLALEQCLPGQGIRTISEISKTIDGVLLLTLTKRLSVESLLVDTESLETFGGKGDIDGGHLHEGAVVALLEAFGVFPLLLSFGGRSDEATGILGQSLEELVAIADANKNKALDLLEKPNDDVALNLVPVESGHDGRTVSCDVRLVQVVGGVRSSYV
jgi:hypothetical protein